MGGNICRKVAEPVEQEEQVPDCCCATETGENVTSEKTNRIMLQYDKADADKLTYFGAKLSTNSEGEHRLVEVKEDGLAQQLHLKNDDVIIELNGADVTDVRRESLLLSLRDLGTKVQFVVNRRNEGKTPEQGRVYFRLEPPEGDAGSGEAHIAKEMHEFINDESSPCMRVTVKDFVLPQTDAFRTLGVYSLDEAKTITLQITKGSEVKELHISRSRAQFKPCAANVCMYKYQQVYFESRTITAYASVPNGSQYGITFDRTGNGTLHVEDFPDCMKTKGPRIPGNNFFFLLDGESTNTDITPVPPVPYKDLHLTSNTSDLAELQCSTNAILKVVNVSDCPQCVIMP